MRRFWRWLCSLWRKPEPSGEPDLGTQMVRGLKKIVDPTGDHMPHWRESYPHNLRVRTKPLMQSGEAYRYTQDEKRQIRRKLPKRRTG
jgi:hypothetical protein